MFGPCILLRKPLVLLPYINESSSFVFACFHFRCPYNYISLLVHVQRKIYIDFGCHVFQRSQLRRVSGTVQRRFWTVLRRFGRTLRCYSREYWLDEQHITARSMHLTYSLRKGCFVSTRLKQFFFLQKSVKVRSNIVAIDCINRKMLVSCRRASKRLLMPIDSANRIV